MYYKYNGLSGKSLWTDTDGFREAALRFLKEEESGKKGSYCPYYDGTYAYKQFWDQEEDRMKNGMTINGNTISGLHYTYLNYCPIYNKAKKKFTFPDFWDLDADWFKQIDYCKNNNKHLCALKARQRGFSLKNAVPLIHNLHFYRKSMNYIGSYFAKYADKSWVMIKDYLNHINRYTDFYKERNPDTSDEIRMAYKELVDGRNVEGGFLSELHNITFKDRAESGVGGAIDLFCIEEGGVFPNLLDVLEFMKPATQDGDIITGLIIVYGSVGDLDKSKGLKDIFYHPDIHGFNEYDNIWDDLDISRGKKSSYFVLEYMCMKPYIDDNGNSDIDSAKKYIEKNRIKEKKKSLRQYLTYISQHPIKPQEAFLSKSVNKYPVEALQRHLSKLETLDSYNEGYGLKLHIDKGVVRPEILHNAIPYENYPVSQTDEGIEGTIWIYEAPKPEKTNGLYIASLDSVDQPNAPTSSSIYSLYIYKRPSGHIDDVYNRKIVANYNGRSENIDAMYDIAINLCDYYNAKLLVESANLGVINHIRNKNKEYILQHQMDEIKGYNPNSVVKRQFGYHPTREVSLHADDLVIKYLTEPIGFEYADDGITVKKEILGLERIKDKGLLREMIHYNNEDNFDRLVAFKGCLLYEEALFKYKISEVNNTNSPLAAAANYAMKNLNKYKQFGRFMKNNRLIPRNI